MTQTAVIDEARFAFTLLNTLNLAVLRRSSSGEYRIFGQPPVFYDVYFPGDGNGYCRRPWDVSPMLEYFLGEAEDFFAQNIVGSISSGFWEEEGLTPENTALMAYAINMGTEQVMVIKELKDEYTERLAMLRTAREQLLETRALAANLSVFKEKSRIDGLTSIFNKSTFLDLMVDEMKRCEIMEYPLSLLVLDIDNFKRVNDTYGHLVGDKVLQGMGKLLKDFLRRNDIVARYGGEEFAVLLPHAAINEAVTIADNIRCGLEEMEIPECPRITVSIGCSAYITDEHSDALFKRADDALYEAKRTGKNRVCVK